MLLLLADLLKESGLPSRQVSLFALVDALLELSLIHIFIKSTAGMVFIVTVLVGIAVHIATGNFFTSYNISTLSRAASFAIIVGFGQTIVLLTGGIDLSRSEERRVGKECRL